MFGQILWRLVCPLEAQNTLIFGHKNCICTNILIYWQIVFTMEPNVKNIIGNKYNLIGNGSIASSLFGSLHLFDSSIRSWLIILACLILLISKNLAIPSSVIEPPQLFGVENSKDRIAFGWRIGFSRHSYRHTYFKTVIPRSGHPSEWNITPCL